MQVNQNDITMTRGDSETITVSCENPDGTVANFTDGDKIYFTIKKGVDETIKTLQKIITIFDNGKAIIEIKHEDTQNIECGIYMYDIQLNRKDGNVTTIIKPSRFAINSEITYE